MIEIRGSTANELFIEAANKLLVAGKMVSPRGMKTLEIEDAWLTLTNPRESVVTLPAR